MVEMFYMRCWVGVVGSIAIVNGLYGYYNSTSAGRTIYTLGGNQAGPLFGRMFASWTLLAGVLRLGFALSTKPSLSMYLTTLFSFVLAFGHFFTEVWLTQTAPLAFPSASPLLISGASIVWMASGLPALLG